MNVDDVVQERIEAARIRIAAAKRRREELGAARRRGLVARHAAKLRNLDAADRRRAAANSVAIPDGTPAGSIRQTDATPGPGPVTAAGLAAVQAQLERIADRLDTEETP
ncbi:hypothetical protein ACFQ60_17805 [Streptomyces zhihengii]|uniref:DUF3618 domain-containing protein n=1 Tax=Streptomyces zhihengii TaxID=1818004 RepID=A0ABS2UW42_9ACTN|nr:hypothetical protein [Streptomyces zhihengii]MBM9621802.1 hypothetical protein [Streptomyces zhihengii]